MTSMFATSSTSATTRLNQYHSTHQTNNECPREIQLKKQALQTLEVALKKRIQELKELCLKEGELTGHLPIDYPLQPREPIPQVRRRANDNLRNTTITSNHDSIDGSGSSSKDTNSIISSTSSSSSLTNQQQQQISKSQRNHLLNGVNSIPTRPTSTISNSSDLSSASSNTRTASSNFVPLQQQNSATTKPISPSYSHPSSLGQADNHVFKEPQLPSGSEPREYKFQSFRFDASLLPNQFKKYLYKPDASSLANARSSHHQYHHKEQAGHLDNDVSLGYIRASSTTSSASSSGSTASSTLSAPVAMSQFKAPYAMVSTNLHTRSCSETIENPHIQGSRLASSNKGNVLASNRKQQITTITGGARLHEDIENDNKHFGTASDVQQSQQQQPQPQKQHQPQHLIRKTNSTSSSSSLVSTNSCPPQPMQHQYHGHHPQNLSQQEQPPVRPPRGLNHLNGGLSHQYHHASAESVTGTMVKRDHRHQHLQSQMHQQQVQEQRQPVRSVASANDVNRQAMDAKPIVTTTTTTTRDNTNFIVSQQQQQKQQTQQKQLFNIDEVTKFQPYYEETKPFQMSDFYKYSAKHRSNHKIVNQQHSPLQLNNYDNQPKTTRRLQEDVARMKNPSRMDKCDDQIQASVKLIEKSGQKLFEATAKALAGNPHLADKLHNIIPSTGGMDHQQHRIRRD